MNFTSACLVVEELSRVDPSVSILVDIHNTLTNNAVRFWGSEELKKKWLPRLASDAVSSFALSEAESGTDAFAMKTTATESPDGSYYTLNGEKLWISNSREAGVFLVFANVNPTLRHKGITAFMVDNADKSAEAIGKAGSTLQGFKELGRSILRFESLNFDNYLDEGNVEGKAGLIDLDTYSKNLSDAGFLVTKAMSDASGRQMINVTFSREKGKNVTRTIYNDSSEKTVNKLLEEISGATDALNPN